MMKTKSIGFVGLGLMGGPMAKRFLDAGYTVIGYDSSPERLQHMITCGITPATSARHVANYVTTVIGSVPDAAASRSVVLDTDGVGQGSMCRYYVETSTIGVRASQDIAAQLAHLGKQFIDSPVSGGPRAIQQGRLTSMVAAPEDALAALQDVYTHLCLRKIVVGTQPGLAQACKLINNAISLSIMQIAAEAAVFGVKVGLDPHILIEAINASSGKSAVTMTKFPASILTRRFDFGATLTTATKDIELFVQEAQAFGMLLDSAPAVAASWRNAADANPHEDFTSIIKRFEAAANVQVGTPSDPPTIEVNAS